MKKICLLLSRLFVVLTLLSGPLAAPLSAQPVTVGNLTLWGDNSLTLDIAWGPGARTAPWADSVWVLIDYKDAGGELRRLPVSGATVSAGQATWPLAKTRTVPGNTAGFFVDGQARTLGAATLTLRVVPELPAGATINKPCAYALDYPPLATYGVDSGDNTVALVGTAPFCGTLINASGTTMTLTSSSASFTLPTGFRVGSYTDLTGNSGLVDCGASRPTVTGSSGALRCGSGVVTLSATSSAGATIDWYSAATGGTLLLSGNTAYSTSVSTSTTYYAQARNTGTQCTSASRTAVVATMYPGFNPGAIAATGQTLCAGGTPALISSATAASGGDGVITYSWYKNGTLIAGATAANYTPPAADATAATTVVYTRKAKDGVCNTTETLSTGAWTMLVNALPVITTQPVAATVCSGVTATFSVAADAGSGTGPNYLWYLNGNSTGNTTASLTTATAGNVYAVVSNSNGCSLTSNTVVFTVLPKPPQPTLTASATSTCQGSYNVHIELPNWYNLQPEIPNEYKNYHISMVVFGRYGDVGPGTYSGQVQHTNGCWSDYSPVLTIADATPPKPTLTAGTLTVCSGATTTITLPDWYGLPNANEKNYHIPGIVWARTANVGAGTYNGQVQSPQGCWSAYSDVVTIASTSCGTGGSCTTPTYTLGTTTWAGCNSTYTGGAWIFASRPDTYTPFVQWNKTSKAWSATASGTMTSWTSGTSTSSTWSSHPCPSGWRLPTLAEFQALLNAGSVWRAAAASGYNNAKAGRFYGSGASTCTLPTPNNCIFLPAVGSRSSDDGMLWDQGSYGAYWSSNEDASKQGCYLTFSSASYNALKCESKKYGPSARCVK